MDKQAEELMADDTVEVVQFKMSGTHPRTDICDLFAKQDAYGLGPGLYPKEHAPRPPLHPFCRCGLISKRLISAKGAQFKPEAHRVYLRQMMAEEGVSKAAQVVGSRAKLAVALSQAPIEEVFNIHRPKPYWVGKIGENIRMTDSSVQSDLDSPLFERFFNADVGAVERFRVAELTKDEQKLFGVRSSALWLSRTSLDEHKVSHPEVGIDDYRKIPNIVHSGQIWQGPDNNRFALLLIDGKPYRAAIKADAQGIEAWFLSLIYNTKQEPPKKAVRVR